MLESIFCDGCGAEVAARLVACPQCQRLMYAADLKRLAGEARAAEEAGDPRAELAAWREALGLLPPGSEQAQRIRGRSEALTEAVDKLPDVQPGDPATAGERRGWAKGLAGAGAIGLFAWKFKAILAFVATKGKLLLLGLSKSSTLFSMLASLAVYWQVWGWKFALAIVLSIYVHEMGHVSACVRRGIKASAPMFVPGVGAFIMLRQHPVGPVEDARISLAGPVWGLAAAALCYAVFLLTGAPFWAVVAWWGAAINMFNLIPFPPLDGSGGFRPLSRGQRWLLILCATLLMFASHKWWMVIGCGVGVLVALKRPEKPEGDNRTFCQFLFLLLALTALLMIDIPEVG